MNTHLATDPLSAKVSGRQSRFRAIGASIVGNALEWYDFTVYAFLAKIIGVHFFPATSSTVSLLSSFAVFGVGFAARPVGGILIGLFGDR